MAKYRSNYLARARITELVEDTGVELPERQVIDRWGEWYEQFLWASLSSHKAWLETLSLGLQSGQLVRIVNPARMIEWLVEHGNAEELPVEEISRFTETLRKVDPNWRTRSVHKSVSLEFEQRRLEFVTDARED